MIKSPISTTLNSSTYTAITLGAQDAFGFSVYAIDSYGALVPFYYATDDSGTDEALAPDAGLTWPHHENMGDTIMYAKSLSGSPSLVLNPAPWVRL